MIKLKNKNEKAFGHQLDSMWLSRTSSELSSNWIHNLNEPWSYLFEEVLFYIVKKVLEKNIRKFLSFDNFLVRIGLIIQNYRNQIFTKEKYSDYAIKYTERSIFVFVQAQINKLIV